MDGILINFFAIRILNELKCEFNTYLGEFLFFLITIEKINITEKINNSNLSVFFKRISFSLTTKKHTQYWDIYRNSNSTPRMAATIFTVRTGALKSALYKIGLDAMIAMFYWSDRVGCDNLNKTCFIDSAVIYMYPNLRCVAYLLTLHLRSDRNDNTRNTPTTVSHCLCMYTAGFRLVESDSYKEKRQGKIKTSHDWLFFYATRAEVDQSDFFYYAFLLACGACFSIA